MADEPEEIFARLRELDTKRTEGVWKLWGMQVASDYDGTSNIDTATMVAQTYQTVNGAPRTFDADLICSLVNNAPWLLELAEEAWAARKENGRA